MVESVVARRAAFTAHMLHLRSCYPTIKHAVPWEEILSEWEGKLVGRMIQGRFVDAGWPIDVLAKAFDAVVDPRQREQARYFPNIADMLELCVAKQEAYAQEQTDKMRGRLLPPPAPRSRTEALRDFLAAADKATREPLSDWSESNTPVVEGVLACLCPVFGVSPLVAMGKEPDSRGVHFNLVRSLVAIWRQMKIKPHAVIAGLKEAPEMFGRFPTEGLLRDLIRGELRPESIPIDYRKHQPPAEPGTSTGEAA